MIKYINPHFINASRLIMLSAIVSIVGFILFGDLTRPDNLYSLAAELIVIIGLAFFIRKQHVWAKWLFLLLTLYSVYALIMMFVRMDFLLPIIGVAEYLIPSICACLNVAASIFLFIKPKQATAELAEADTIGPLDALDE